MELSSASDGASRPTYVLVHGAWFGGWVWKEVAPRLRAAGHEVHAPTLTGLGDRRHLAGSEYDLSTHVQDIVSLIEMEDLRDIDLVGWSYGGMVVTGVLARIPERIRSVVYLDAFVPENGKCLADYAEPWVLPTILEARDRNGFLSPMPFEVMALEDPERVKFASSRVAEQFWRTFMTPAAAIPRPDIPFTYVRCTKFANPSFDEALKLFEAEGHRTIVMDSGHVPMLDHVEETSALLLD